MSQHTQRLQCPIKEKKMFRTENHKCKAQKLGKKKKQEGILSEDEPNHIGH